MRKPTHKFVWITSFVWRYVCLFFLSSTSLSGQEIRSLDDFVLSIDSLERANKMEEVTLTYLQGSDWVLSNEVAEDDPVYLDFQLKRTRHLLRFSQIAVDSAIQSYQHLYQTASRSKNYEIETRSLGFLANAYRSKSELGKAFEYNQKEIEAARRSKMNLLYGRALITEMDIAYNSLPSPMEPSDLEELVTKGTEVIRFSEDNELPSVVHFGKLYLSKFYIKQNELIKAEEILFSISDEESLPVTFSKYEHLCEIAKLRNDLKNYRKYTLEFKTRAYKTKRTFVALNAHNYLLDYSLQSGAADSASFYAEKLEQNLSEVDTTKYLDFLDVSYATLADYYKGKDLNKELRYISYSATVNRLISARQKEAFSAIMKYKNEVQELESENSNLAKANSFFKNNLLLSVGILVALAIIAILIFQKYKKKAVEAAEIREEKQHLEESVHKQFIELHNKQRIHLEDLKYIKADRNYVEFYTSEKRYVDRHVLSSVLEELPPNFIQVHRSYVINRNFIKSHSRSTIFLDPDIEIPFSRTFRNRLQLSL